jgi:hypothetical protein
MGIRPSRVLFNSRRIGVAQEALTRSSSEYHARVSLDSIPV